MKPDFKVINIKTKTKQEAILYYIKSTSFIHKITAPKDQRAMSYLILKYLEFSKDVLREDLINTLLFSTETANEIKDASGMNKQEYSTLLSKMEDKKLIKENTLSKNIIPILKEDDSIELRIKFKEIDSV